MICSKKRHVLFFVGTQKWKQLTIQTLLQLFPRKNANQSPIFIPELNIHFSALLPHFSATQWSMLCHHFLAVLLEFQIQSQVGITAEAHIHDELPNHQLRAENITGYVRRGKKIELIRKERTLYSRWCLWFQVAEAISKMIKQKRNLLKRYWADHRIIESKLETSVQGDAPNQSSEKTAAEPLHSRLSELDHHHLCIRTSLLLQPLLLPAAMPLLPQKSNFASFTPNTNPKCCAFLL